MSQNLAVEKPKRTDKSNDLQTFREPTCVTLEEWRRANGYTAKKRKYLSTRTPRHKT